MGGRETNWLFQLFLVTSSDIENKKNPFKICETARKRLNIYIKMASCNNRGSRIRKSKVAETACEPKILNCGMELRKLEKAGRLAYLTLQRKFILV